MNDQSSLDIEILQDFIIETNEHLSRIELNCLDLENNSSNSDILNNLFRSFHTIKGLAGFIQENSIQEISHKTETLLDCFRKNGGHINSTVVDLILKSADLIKYICGLLEKREAVSITAAITEHMANLNDWVNFLGSCEKVEPNAMRLGEVMLREGKLTEEELSSLLKRQKETGKTFLLGQLAVLEGKATPQQVVESLRKQEVMCGDLLKTGRSESSTMRIASDKVDSLVDMMGELLILQAVMEQEAKKRFTSDDVFMQNLVRNVRITKRLQDSAMSLRMISLKPLLQRAQRIGRDTAKALNKQVNVAISGEETEADRNVTEKLAEPLMHLVRNCVGHGIENSQTRAVSGKPETGQINIRAFTRRGHVYLEISDDGQGIDHDKIYKKALDKRLIDSTKTYSRDEILDIIFLPGFTTAKEVDSVSGRGVGLDVVKTEILKLGGRVELKTEKNKGTAFTLKLPVNLAVINGTVIVIAGSFYIIPTLSIKKIEKISDANWITIKDKRRMIKQGNELYSLIPIDQILELERCPENLVVVVEQDGIAAAIPVDEVKERRDIVVKSLNGEFRDLGYASGATILGDGRVSLILDIENLIRIGGGKSDKGFGR